MAKKGSARRYAQAVFELDGKKNINDRQSELEEVAKLGQDAEIIAYLNNPKVSFDDKIGLLHDRLSDVTKTVLNLVYLLISKGRVSMLPDIADEYRHLVDEHNGIERADVTTAIPIDDKDRQNLSEKLSDITGKKVIIESEHVDPDLIGGIIVKVAGKLIDGSTRGRLAELKKEMI
ncbi:MAG: ATP synthase F1 subunit delta [Chloroflexota bacterium]